MVSPVVFSSKLMGWESPQELWEQWQAKYDFVLDAAASAENHKLPIYYTEDGFFGYGDEKLSDDDGLTGRWAVRTWCNPPYARGITGKWVKKAWDELCKGNSSTLLLPVRTDQPWFHTYINNQPNARVEFLKGRLAFEIDGEAMRGPDGRIMKAPFPSMLVHFGGH